MKALVCFTLIYLSLVAFGPGECKKKVKLKIKVEQEDENLLVMKQPQLLIVSLDGFGENYLALFPRETQTLRSLAQGGYREIKLKVTSASVLSATTTASALWSHATGVSPRFHSIVNSKFFDSKLNETFEYPKDSNNLKWFKSTYEPLWSLAERQNRKTYVVDWIASRVSFPRNILPPSFTEANGNHDLTTLFNNAIHLFKNNVIQLAMIHFKEPGYTASKYGNSSILTRRTLESIDRAFYDLKNNLKKANLYSSLNLVVISGSAFADVTQIIHFFNFTEKSNNCTQHSLTTGGLAHFWAKNATCKSKLFDQLLDYSKNLQVWKLQV